MTASIANPVEPRVAFPWRAYQKESFDVTRSIRLKFWCRQTGKDETTAFDSILRGLSDPRHADRGIISVTQRQADYSIEKVARHARAMDVLAGEDSEDFEANIGGKAFQFSKRIVTLPATGSKKNGRGGVRIIALPGRDPDSVVGGTMHLYFTEFALFPNGGFEHWRRLTPMALNNGLDVDVVTTPRGKDTKAYELRQNARGRYSVSVVDIYRAVQDGLVLRDEDGKPCSIEAFKEIYGDAIGWQTEYLVQECDDLSALIPWGDIEAAYEPYDAVMLDYSDSTGYDRRNENIFAQLKGLTGPLTCGWDVARKKDLATFWLNEQVGNRQYLRMLIIFRRCSFPFQRENMIEQAMDTLPNLMGCGDSTGLGLESNEALQRKYAMRWRPINFASSKVTLGSRLTSCYQGRGQAFPASAESVGFDLHALQKEVKGDRIIIHETANTIEPDSHCDIAWANALALEAASVQFAEPGLWMPEL